MRPAERGGPGGRRRLRGLRRPLLRRQEGPPGLHRLAVGAQGGDVRRGQVGAEPGTVEVRKKLKHG